MEFINNLSSNQNSIKTVKSFNNDFILDSNNDVLDEIQPENHDLVMDYYGVPNQITSLHIYLQNPFSFEILSFTLNEEKYQSFQFQEGSNSELLILNVTLPSTPGRIAYTIDQLKYVDGTEIKDVRLDGDQTVTVGVQYAGFPALNKSDFIIDKKSIQTQISLVDSEKMLEDAGASIYALIIDQAGEYLNQKVTSNNQVINFSNLPSGKTYTFIISGLFDLLDGKGYQQHIYAESLIETQSFINFSNIITTKHSVTFDLIEDDTLNQGNLVRVELLNQGIVIRQLNTFSNLEFNDLLAATEYTLRAVYQYQYTGSPIQTLLRDSTFFTGSYQAPEVDFESVVSTQNSIQFDLIIDDPDEIGSFSKAEIFENTALISTINNGQAYVFQTLKSNTLYLIRVTYTFNLLDGKGNQAFVAEYQTTTANQLIAIQSGTILLTNGSTVPNVGEELQLRLNLINPDGITISGVVLNGEKFDAVTPNNTIIIIKFIPDSFGGTFNIFVSQLIYQLNGVTIYQAVTNPYQSQIDILGGLDITNLLMADGKDYVNIKVTNEELAIEIDNPFGYKIYEVVVLYDKLSVTYTGNQIKMVDSTTIFLDWRGPEGATIYFGEWYSKITIQSITYGLSSDKTNKQNYQDEFKFFYFVNSDVVQNINSVSDLVNIQTGRYTVINQDLDLSSIGNWIPKDFIGIIDGKGHKISNLSIFVNNNNAGTQNFGLFKKFVGKITGLIVDYAVLDIQTIGDVNVGILSALGSTTSGLEVNEIRILNSIMNVKTSGVANVGAISGGSGLSQNSYLDNVSITVNSLSENVSKTSHVGGFFANLGTDAYVGFIKDSYTSKLTMNVSSLANLKVGGFTATAVKDSSIKQTFHTDLKINITSPETGLNISASTTSQIDLDTFYIGTTSFIKVNNADLTIQNATLIEPSIFKSDFIYSSLNWDSTIWTYRGPNSFLLPFLIEPYTLTFISNGGSSIIPITQDYLTSLIQPSDPSRNGYTFGGWYLDIDFIDEFAFEFMPFEGANLYAKWDIITYDITYNLNNGVNNEGNRNTYTIEDETFLFLEPTRTGYTFSGWFNNSSFTGSPISQVVKGTFIDLTLYAKWTINTYTITYSLNGGVNGDNPVDYTIETAMITLADASRVGYTFIGWYDNAALTGDAVETIVLGSFGNIALYAKFEINEYTISFDSNEGSAVEAITQDYATEVVAPADPTRDGYTFAGWFSDEALTEAYTFTTMPADDITLYAKWTINTYTITYSLNGGVNGDNPVDYTIETATITLADASRVGYTFIGWYDNAALTGDAVETIVLGSFGNIALYAKFEINEYTISFDSNEGSAVEAITQDYATEVVAPADPTRDGYTFAGWFSDEALTEAYTFTTMPADDLTLYAKWNEIIEE
jgi:uncharacterized repeat protein (TIGR02543 family)